MKCFSEKSALIRKGNPILRQEWSLTFRKIQQIYFLSDSSEFFPFPFKIINPLVVTLGYALDSITSIKAQSL